jgi:hypothetical protein
MINLDVNAMIVEINGFVEASNREVILKVLRFVVVRSPELSGDYKSSHMVKSGTPSTEIKTGGFIPGANYINDNTLKFGKKVYVSNNLPYAEKLEFGHSEGAPLGIYRLVTIDTVS